MIDCTRAVWVNFFCFIFATVLVGVNILIFWDTGIGLLEALCLLGLLFVGVFAGRASAFSEVSESDEGDLMEWI